MSWVVLFAVVAAGTANAYSILTQWDLTGKTGSETQDASGNTAPHVTGLYLTRSNNLTGSLTPSSFAATGWNTAGQYYQFGFTVAQGYKVNLNELLVATYSSGTGPGTIGVYGSTDNFAHQALLATLTQPSAAYIDSQIFFDSKTTITGTYLVRLEAVGATSADGHTTTATGSFQVSNYYDGASQTYSPVSFYGDAGTIPLPGTVWMLASGLAGLIGIRMRSGGKSFRV